jgi:hypothetical protein
MGWKWGWGEGGVGGGVGDKEVGSGCRLWVRATSPPRPAGATPRRFFAAFLKMGQHASPVPALNQKPPLPRPPPPTPLDIHGPPKEESTHR